MTGLELWWLGQAGFRLRDPTGGPIVFCDPFLTVRDDRTWQAPVDPSALAEADLVLVSHEHIDHLDRPSLEAASAVAGARFTLVVPRPLRDDVVHDLNLPEDRVLGAQPDEVLERAGVRVHPVPARHGVNVSDAYTFGQELSNGHVRYLGYVVELGGVRVYHAGDCSPYSGQAERIKALGPQVALLPINGRDFFRETEHNIVGNMDFREAARLASDIDVELMVPMHWELFLHNRGFPGDLVAYVEAEFPTLSVLVMGRGARILFTPAGG
jgi:L-ascorbate metabolism protein UlaG (beta-lactamase superfamily)